jgi:hypothetical protein
MRNRSVSGFTFTVAYTTCAGNAQTNTIFLPSGQFTNLGCCRDSPAPNITVGAVPGEIIQLGSCT